MNGTREELKQVTLTHDTKGPQQYPTDLPSIGLTPFLHARISFLLVFCMPSLALLLLMCLVAASFLIPVNGRMDVNYQLLGAILGVTAAVAGLSFRAASVSQEPDDRVKFRISGERLTHATLLFALTAGILYPTQLFARGWVPAHLVVFFSLALPLLATATFYTHLGITVMLAQLFHAVATNPDYDGYIDRYVQSLHDTRYTFPKQPKSDRAAGRRKRYRDIHFWIVVGIVLLVVAASGVMYMWYPDRGAISNHRPGHTLSSAPDGP